MANTKVQWSENIRREEAETGFFFYLTVYFSK